MNILAIDTSADDTSAAVVIDRKIASNIIWSQLVHKEWGGIVPSLAKLEHARNIQPAVQKALKQAKITIEEIELIAVTYGPGLSIALEVGISCAKELATAHTIPILPVNHMEGHLYASEGLRPKSGKDQDKEFRFPLLGLLVSGGHTEIVLMQKHGEYTVLAETLDDAVGEAFDKVARMVGLGYPGGKALAELAVHGDPFSIDLPEPLVRTGQSAFSYSGLKTAVMKQVKFFGEQMTKKLAANIAASFQRVAIDHLERKLEKQIATHHPVMIVLGGGVAANLELRKRMRKMARKHNVSLLTPYTTTLCQDNAAMIGVAAERLILSGRTPLLPSQLEQLDRDPSARIDQIKI